MCGIAGIINSGIEPNELERRLRKLEQDLHHRGPDDQGIFVSRDGIAGLVNTRLSILDLSAAGHQPMSSPDGRYTIVFNGEIYNFESLRADLATEGETFRSHSDTEVILKMYARYGPDCVREFAGMFTIAIWDEVDQICFVARDPLGIKPLYVYEQNKQMIFGSEVRALLATGLIPRRLCHRALNGYLLFGTVPEPFSLVADLRTLSAGHYLLWQNGQTRITKFWDFQCGNEPISGSEAVALTRSALVDSVRRHWVSDVPVGVFLSGGIDSTAVVALSSETSNIEVRTFSISFDDPRFNEGDVAARTAQHFGTKHSDWRLDSKTAKPLLAQFLEKSDQPSVDGFNTFCVSKLAHDHGLKVVLSGLGGDEVFGGYPSFRLVPRMVQVSRSLEPIRLLKRVAGKTLERVDGSARLNRLGHFFSEVPTTIAAYWATRGIFTPLEIKQLLPRYASVSSEVSQFPIYVPPQPTLKDEVSYLEIAGYMRNQLLRDSDIMSMAWSLELRVPFADSHLIDAVARVPARLRLARGKQLLLDVVPEIPEWVRNRPKQGFTFPFKDWITGEWSDVFRRIEGESPIRLKNWYRCWCLFALENFLEKNRIETSAVLAV
jgi:asparagine synthase (glutamine-hydrolysing)